MVHGAVFTMTETLLPGRGIVKMCGLLKLGLREVSLGSKVESACVYSRVEDELGGSRAPFRRRVLNILIYQMSKQALDNEAMLVALSEPANPSPLAPDRHATETEVIERQHAYNSGLKHSDHHIFMGRLFTCMHPWRTGHYP